MANAQTDTGSLLRGIALRGITLRSRLLREMVERIEALEAELAAGDERRPHKTVREEGEFQSPSSPGAESLSAQISRLQDTIDRLESELSEFGEDAIEVAEDRVWEQVGCEYPRDGSQLVPADATVAVANPGDKMLMRLYGRRAVSSRSADDPEGAGPDAPPKAIEKLEDARREGANFLLLPRSAFGWLSEGSEFAQHLSQHYPAVVRDDNCVLYSLGFLPESRERWPRQNSGSSDDGIVSVILPVHNGIRPEVGDRWLDESISSVLAQGDVPLELVSSMTDR